MRIVSIGEVLWDVIEGREYLGGAPLNFAAHAARLGHSVCLVSAVGKDERGRRVLERMAALGLSTRYICELESLPTGVVTVSLDAAGVPRFTIHHPAAYDAPAFDDACIAELLSLSPAWIYLGTLFQMTPQGRALTYKLIDTHSGTRVFYDVNLRQDSYQPTLVRGLMGRAQVVKLNEEEAAAFDEMSGRRSNSLEQFCRTWAGEFGWQSACVTRGQKGCVLLVGDEFVEASGYPVRAQDTVGSGDAFAAALLHGLSLDWPPPAIADFANRLAALVASRAGAIPPWTLDEVCALTK